MCHKDTEAILGRTISGQQYQDLVPDLRSEGGEQKSTWMTLATATLTPARPGLQRSCRVVTSSSRTVLDTLWQIRLLSCIVLLLCCPRIKYRQNQAGKDS